MEQSPELHLVVRALRLGRMFASESGKRAGPQRLRRPLGCAVLSLWEVLGGREPAAADRELSLRLQQSEERDFSQLHDLIIRQASKFSPLSGQGNYGQWLQLQVYSGQGNYGQWLQSAGLLRTGKLRSVAAACRFTQGRVTTVSGCSLQVYSGQGNYGQWLQSAGLLRTRKLRSVAAAAGLLRTGKLRSVAAVAGLLRTGKLRSVAAVCRFTPDMETTVSGCSCRFTPDMETTVSGCSCRFTPDRETTVSGCSCRFTPDRETTVSGCSLQVYSGQGNYGQWLQSAGLLRTGKLRSVAAVCRFTPDMETTVSGCSCRFTPDMETTVSGRSLQVYSGQGNYGQWLQLQVYSGQGNYVRPEIVPLRRPSFLRGFYSRASYYYMLMYLLYHVDSSNFLISALLALPVWEGRIDRMMSSHRKDPPKTYINIWTMENGQILVHSHVSYEIKMTCG